MVCYSRVSNSYWKSLYVVQLFSSSPQPLVLLVDLSLYLYFFVFVL